MERMNPPQRLEGVSENLSQNSWRQGRGRMGRWLVSFLKKRVLFLALVVLPTLAGIFYYGVLASDVYVSESKFLIRQPEKKSTSSLGMFLQSAGITNNRDEVYTVREYLLSRAVLKILSDNLDLQKKFSSSKIDFLQRFNVSGFSDTFEDFYKYFKDLISIEVDTTSSMCECKIKAFTPALAHSINAAMLFLGEGFINGLNERARQDMIRFNSDEVKETEESAKEAALALSHYRDRQTILDPNQQSSMQLQQIAKIQSDLLEVRTQLSQYRHFAAKSPLIEALEKRRAELEKQIGSETSSIIGNKNSLAQKMMEYDRLVLDVDFANKRLAAAMASLQQSKSEAQRQQLYLERVVEPETPDAAAYPKRLPDILCIFFGSLMVYGIVKFFIMGVREHQA